MTKATSFDKIAGATPLRKAEPMSPPEIRQRVTELGPWFHNIQLAPGVATREIAPSPGPQPMDHPLRRWRVYQDVLPQDMSGMKVLDLGCADGFFAIEMARRGAHVLAQDIWRAMIERLRFAAQIAGMQDRIWTRVGDVSAIGGDEHYDAILCLGLLYHLRHPFRDLETIAAATDLLWLETTLHPGDESFLYFKPPAEGVHHIRKWFPTRSCVRAMLEECKFTTISDIADPTPNRGSFLAQR